MATETKSARFAGGGFCGMEELFREQPGVVDTEAGYAGGENENPTYRNHPGHAEALKITYDPERTSFRKLLDFFFQIHDPTTLNRQGNDIGTSYRSTIFFETSDEKKQAEEFIQLVNNSGRWENPVVTSVEPLSNYTPAEEEHQDYLQKQPGGYTCHFIRPGGSYLPRV